MPSAYTQNFYHTVFSTKHRANLITPELEERLNPFVGGILRDLRCPLLAINGMPDHVHVLVRYRADLSHSEMLQKIKGRSSKWINETFPQHGHSHGKKATADSPSANPSCPRSRRTSRAKRSITSDRTFDQSSWNCCAGMESSLMRKRCLSRFRPPSGRRARRDENKRGSASRGWKPLATTVRPTGRRIARRAARDFSPWQTRFPNSLFFRPPRSYLGLSGNRSVQSGFPDFRSQTFKNRGWTTLPSPSKKKYTPESMTPTSMVPGSDGTLPTK